MTTTALHPDLINCATIQALPRTVKPKSGYLVHSFFASHPSVSFKLKNYDADADAYSHWMFLASCYTEAKKNHDPVAEDIKRLFRDVFGAAALERGNLSQVVDNFYVRLFRKQVQAIHPDLKDAFDQWHARALQPTTHDIQRLFKQTFGKAGKTEVERVNIINQAYAAEYRRAIRIEQGAVLTRKNNYN